MNKKTFLLGLTALLGVTTLVSCGEEDSDRERKNGTKVLTYLVSSESEAYKAILSDLLEEFNASIADEGYEIKAQTPGGEYYNSLGTKLGSNSAPDIFMMEVGYFNAYAQHLEPLDKYIQNSSVLSTSDLWDLNDAFKYNGEYRALIKDFSPDFMLIYNKTMLEEYNSAHVGNEFVISETEPMTWLEFYEMTSTIQKYHNLRYGTSLGFEPVKHLHELVQMTGSHMYTSDYKGLNISDTNVQEAFKFFCALQKDNATEFTTYFEKNKNDGKAPASYTAGSNLGEDQLFKQGMTFSLFNGLYYFPAKDLYNCNFEVGVAPSPVMNKGDKAYSITSAMVSHAISRRSKYKDIAWRFLEFYQTKGLEKYSEIAFNIPGNKTIAGSDYFLKNDNPKVQAMTNYFYNYVSSGAVHAPEYNPLIDFSRIGDCFGLYLPEFYNNNITFDKLLENINQSISRSV